MGEAREVSDSTGAHHATGRLTPKIPYRGLRRETPPIMATTVGPARVKADNSADRCSIAQNVWLPVRRFHVGTSTKMLTLDAGYTTATDSRVDLPTAFLLCRGRSPYTRVMLPPNAVLSGAGHGFDRKRCAVSPRPPRTHSYVSCGQRNGAHRPVKSPQNI